jgi:hypothetical protein
MFIRKGILWAVLAGLWNSMLWFLGLALIGAGHGTDFFGAAIVAPFQEIERWGACAFLFWPLVGFLAGLSSSAWCRGSAGALILLHYFGIVVLWWDAERTGIVQAWNSSAGFIMLLGGAYGVGQLALWRALLARQRRTN